MSTFGYDGTIIQLNYACSVTAEYREDKCVSGVFMKLDRKNTDVATFESQLADHAHVPMRNHTIYTIKSYNGMLCIGAEGEVLEIGASVIERRNSNK